MSAAAIYKYALSLESNESQTIDVPGGHPGGRHRWLNARRLLRG